MLTQLPKAGANCTFLHYIGRQCDVSPSNSSYDPIKAVPIVCSATAFQSPYTGQLYILIFKEAIWIQKLPNSLINPNQLRYFGIFVQDDPTSTIPLHIRTEDARFNMPLKMKGTVIFEEKRKPTEKELDKCPHVVLSSPHEWESSKVKVPQPKKQSLDEVVADIRQDMGVSAFRSRAEFVPASIGGNEPRGDDEHMTFYQCGNTFCICTHRSKMISNFRNTSTRLIINYSQAIRTLQKSTQRFKHSAIMPLTRKYRADRMFSRKYLAEVWSTDILVGKVKSLEQNRYAQVFLNKNYFATTCPLKKKSQAGEALNFFCRECGVPKQAFGGSKKQNG